ncbi:nucleoside/nucleotide kinase family protein [Pseudochrobactrum sp. sp1633]|uniref:nucleoside/nucleotide kinase family protein n=1 Tax=Pseudochrobactrum sp. sp1633 TaxID=3036706 RepID=UPI0025A534F4|nr:nucleoside/nucleotide kinase family protein [Pseudochrobactrum sp. sp1633]MDM8344228.1 nucleoside/nucleotide kinase family protein [Pseudochrobactrum sp. sp1633]HWD14639.1 nucleoside/nucleotide kinase family protein [Pseudochrobactrum sp.]
MSDAQVMKREALAADILARAKGRHRLIVAIAGAPAAGKSTLAEELCHDINRLSAAQPSIVVPMDGFHYDNAILDARGYRARKGAPHTFDADGFKALLARLKNEDGDIAIPVFDRAMDLARAGAAMVTAQHQILLVEGNYLLLDQPVWRDLRQYFDLSIFLQVPFSTLEQRLIQRWLDYGADEHAARTRALANDIPNAQTVVEQSQPADFILQD